MKCQILIIALLSITLTYSAKAQPPRALNAIAESNIEYEAQTAHLQQSLDTTADYIEYDDFLSNLADLGLSLQDYFEIMRMQILIEHQLGEYLEEYSLYEQYEEFADLLDAKSTEAYWEYLAIKAETLSSLFKDEEYELNSLELDKLTTSLYGAKSMQALIVQYTNAKNYALRDNRGKAKEAIDNCYKILNSKKFTFESTIDSLNIMSNIHNVEGITYITSDVNKAEASFLLALEETKKLNDLDNIEHGIEGSLSNLGLLYFQGMQDFQKAKEYFELAVQYMENNGDTSSLNYLDVLSNLAACYMGLGMLSQAITIIDIACGSVEKNYGKNHILYGTIEQNRSYFYMKIGDYQSAISSCNNALECYEEIVGKISNRYASTLNNLSYYYMLLGDYATSKEIALTATDIMEQLNDPMILYPYMVLLNVYAYENDFESLEALAKRAIKIIDDYGWEESDRAMLLCGCLGTIFSKIGFNKSQIEIIEQGKEFLGMALGISEKIGKSNSIEHNQLLTHYFIISIVDGTQTEEDIATIFNSYRNLYDSEISHLNANERESLMEEWNFINTKNVIFSSRETDNSNALLYDFLLLNKGLLLETSIGYAKAVYNSGDSSLVEKYDRLKNIHRYLNGEIESFNNYTIEEALSATTILEREITFTAYQNGLYTDNLAYTYEDVRESLKDNELAIEFVTYLDLKDNNTYYVALLAKDEWSTPQYVKLCTKEELERLISQSPDRLYGETYVSETTYNLIWKPIEPFLDSIETIYFSPAGDINRLAVEYLYNGDKHINESYNLVRMTSTREVCNNYQPYDYRDAVLYGGLKYDEEEETMIAESRNVNKNFTTPKARFRGVPGETRKNSWNALPGTFEEVSQIYEIINGANINCTLYSEEKGNEESFKALSGKDFEILHIATHGFYMTETEAEKMDLFTQKMLGLSTDNSLPSLQRAGLILSGGNKVWMGETIPEGVEDGILTAAEVANLDLNSCDIVVLSACETGLGDITDEGVFGLQRAFKSAGVNTIIMSLWEVDDEATSLMMRIFYENLVSGKSKREAFYIAQEEVRKQFPNPSDWAAFIILD